VNHGRFQAIRNRINVISEWAKTLYGVDLSGVKTTFDLRGKVSGYAQCKLCRDGRKEYSMRFNCDLIEGDHYEDIINTTVPHEMAHIICMMRPELGKNHDRGWRRVCIALGGNGKTTHDFAVKYARGNYVYRSTTGHEVTISGSRHGKIQNGKVYIVRGRGRINKDCEWKLAE
jgi:predicted SprT family Zn-dependent metalloprotease